MIGGFLSSVTSIGAVLVKKMNYNLLVNSMMRKLYFMYKPKYLRDDKVPKKKASGGCCKKKRKASLRVDTNE